MKIQLIITALFSMAASASAQGLSGNVYHDSNRNGVKDAGEPGIKNISVSDGRHVVKTDAEGNYNLPGHARQKFIFITPAAGYNFVNNYYLPVDSGKSTYNFPMYHTGKTDASSHFVRITDTETSLYGNWINEVKNFARNEAADFIVHTGDICYEKGMQFHAQQVNTKTMGLPVYYCVGNHDLVKGPYGEALYESLFGPVFYSFEYGNTHFVVTPMPYGDYKPSYTYDDLYYWLQNDLANTDPSKSVVVFNHDLLTFGSDFTIKNSKGEVLNLNQHNLKAWIYGHWHYNFAHQHGNSGIRSLCAAPAADGGIDNSISNFELIQVDKDGIQQVTRRYSYVANHISLITPTVNGISYRNGKMQVSANIYQTDEILQTVNYKVYSKKGNLLKSLSLQPSGDWNWHADIEPAVMKPYLKDTCYSTLEATLRSGRVLFRRDTFVMQPPMTVKSTNETWNQTLQNAQRVPVTKQVNFSGLQLLWSSNLGAAVWKSAPILNNGKLYLATIDDENLEKCAIVAMEANTGKVLWRYKTTNSIKHSLSLSGNYLLGTDAEGITYALDAATGKLRWQHNGPMKGLPPYNCGGVVYEDMYITGTGNFLQALDIKTGNPRWTNTSWNGGEATPTAMTIWNNLLITSSNWNHLFAHDLQTGQLRWKRSDGGIRFRSGTPAVHQHKLLVQGINMLHVLNEEGKTIDSIKVNGELKTMTAPAIWQNQVLLATAADGVQTYELGTGKWLYGFKPLQALSFTAPYSLPPAATVESTPIINGNHAFIAAADGWLYVLDLAAKGRLVAKFEVGAPVYADMALAGEVLYVADFSGNVNAFRLH
ncbi:Outer membrane protein assembly factor BamB, contains PQQ-like beta-propeller repeat [Chitinophaga jiangningensis]|uniref:Outer membrane protein assembly factor BamB, contains PQQ-like beta-propeller repeat n=1 Tax=Chitinophaga jiangningensis TaxID=1419482 RepID=A0A1M7FHS1_9BACT|nr:PQQ-binding-like beta-propeller repeat protein [Chitinophaga jiangningensis]SHM03338.1 Outer membrane protein assembly factor BamB, contains PQQ-like beta-propeller repeat [Chitinophaga jiangningensis]